MKLSQRVIRFGSQPDRISLRLWKYYGLTPVLTPVPVRFKAIVALILTFVTCLTRCWADLGSPVQLRQLQDRLIAKHGAFGRSISEIPIEDMRRILTNPPNISDALFYTLEQSDTPGHFGTNYWRSACSTNGYILNLQNSLRSAHDIVYTGTTYGRFGNTNWRGSDGGTNWGGVLFMDASQNNVFFKTDRMREALRPLKLGSISLGTGIFQNDIDFVAEDSVDRKMKVKGRLITTNNTTVSGVAYQVSKFPDVVYVVTWLDSLQTSNTNKIAFEGVTDVPIGGTASYYDYNIKGESGIMEGVLFSYLRLTTNNLDADYFHPSRWISNAPSSEGIVVANELYAKLNGKLIKSSEVQPITKTSPMRRCLLILFFGLITVPFIYYFSTMKRRSEKSNHNTQE